jgi:hypothetical protein
MCTSHKHSLSELTTADMERTPPFRANCRRIDSHVLEFTFCLTTADMASLHTKTTTHTQGSTHSAVPPAGLRGASLRSIKSRSSNAAVVSTRKQARLVAVRAAAEEKGENRACGHLWCITTTTSNTRDTLLMSWFSDSLLPVAVEEVQLGKAAAVAPQSDNWVPVCRPEDLPKGECQPAATIQQRLKTA